MNYAAAMITLVDRESSKLTTAYAYPITKVELRERDNPEHNVRTFTVNADGVWTEDYPPTF